MMRRETNGLRPPFPRISLLAALLSYCLIAVISQPLSAQSTDEPPPAAALLKTDPELEYRLGRADELAAMGEYVLVIPLWQEALDASRDVMFSRDDQLYRPIGLEIEHTICSLPPQALRAYRLSADGEVAAMLAEVSDPQAREAALMQIVQRFFLSTKGDDAAYELGCRALDRCDFIYATHLFNRILEDYPDSDLDPAVVYLRLAVAQVELGARSDAADSLKQFRTLRPEAAESALVLAIAAQIDEVPEVFMAQSEPGTWHHRLGTLTGDGTQSALPPGMDEGELVELWHHDFRTGSQVSTALEQSTAGLEPFRGLQDMPHARLPRGGSEAQWEAYSQWVRHREDSQYSVNQPFPITGHPNAQLLFDQGRMYFKTPVGLVCADAHTGRVLWQGLESSFAIDLNTELYNWLRSRGGSGTSTPSESLNLYGDRINQSMAISNGEIFTIEGDSDKHRLSVNEYQGFEMLQSGVPRTRYNFLTAYEAHSGKVLWRYPGGREFYREDAADSEREHTEDGSGFYELGFMGPPAPLGRLVLAPVQKAGDLWLYALDRRDGTLVWRTFLCEELPSASDPWAPVGIAVQGGEVYVSTGCSAVMALDSRTGAVRWALHYDSIVPFNGLQGYYYGNYGYVSEERVWEENHLVIYGNALIVMAADSDLIQARDRRDGSLLWESPIQVGNSSAAYCLGLLGNKLYVAGLNVVRCIEITSNNGSPNNGRILWEHVFDPREGLSLGRGLLTEGGIYYPFNDEIVHLDPVSGGTLQTLAVSKPHDIDPENELAFLPVGNLYSDGQWLHMVSPGRISAWATPELRQEGWSMPEDAVYADAPAASEEQAEEETEGSADAAARNLPEHAVEAGIEARRLRVAPPPADAVPVRPVAPPR